MLSKIYAVTKSTSYDIFGESHIISYHKSEEGAYFRLDQEAESEGFKKEDLKTSYDGSYYYSNDNRSLTVDVITLEE